MRIEDVPIKKIQFDSRYRKDEGDIDSLAANISQIGLLHPIGVDEYYTLIYGMRRLHACTILGWKTIPCNVVSIKSLLTGEYSENEFRKQLTPSEKDAIGKALAREDEKFRKQQGKRTDRLVDDGPQVAGEKTRSRIAKAAGFASDHSMRDARTVVSRGAPEVIQAMDSGEVSISAAAAIASQPKKDQAAIVAMPKDERREAVRQIRKTKADKDADEKRARDLRLFRGLYDAVRFIGDFHEDPQETWDGLWRVSAYHFADDLDRALRYLGLLRKARPNENQLGLIKSRTK